MKHLILLFAINMFFSWNAFAQTEGEISSKIEKYIEENSKITYREITSDTLTQILKHKVYFVTLETRNMYNNTGRDLDDFIVIDSNQGIKSFEKGNKNSSMSELLSYIKEDYVLNDKTAGLFQGLFDLIYPVPSWKTNKTEFLTQDGKWYFLRDSFFDSNKVLQYLQIQMEKSHQLNTK